MKLLKKIGIVALTLSTLFLTSGTAYARHFIFIRQSGPITYATWNPAAKGTVITLSALNLTETASGAGQGEVRATAPIVSGTKRYWEVRANTTTTDMVIGIDDGSASLNAFTGADIHGWGYYGNSGGVFHSGVNSGTQTAYVNGDIIGMALDNVGHTLQYYKNNVIQGSAITIPSGNFFPAAGTGLGAWATTARFDPASMTYAPPAGFTAGVF